MWKLSESKWSHLYEHNPKKKSKAGRLWRVLAYDCLIVTITKDHQNQELAQKPLQSYTKPTSTGISAQQPSVQPWTDATLVINHCGQRLFEKYLMYSSPFFSSKTSPCHSHSGYTVVYYDMCIPTAMLYYSQKNITKIWMNLRNTILSKKSKPQENTHSMILPDQVQKQDFV